MRVSRNWIIQNQWMLAHWIRQVARNRMVVISYKSERYWLRSYIFCFLFFLNIKNHVIWCHFDYFATLVSNGQNGRNDFDHWRLKSRNSRNDVISHDFSYWEKTINKKCTISVNIAPIRMKKLPFDSLRLDGSNELTFIDFGSSNREIITIVLSAEIMNQ